MRRIITVIALAATMLLASASMAMAGPNENAAEPNENAICVEDTANIGYGNHGAHIRAYVFDGVNDGPGGDAKGGGPAHFGLGALFTPGASFCQGDNSAPALPPR